MPVAMHFSRSPVIALHLLDGCTFCDGKRKSELKDGTFALKTAHSDFTTNQIDQSL